jgi:transposase
VVGRADAPEPAGPGGPEPTPEAPVHLRADKGYDYADVREVVELWGFTAHVKARGEEAAEKATIPGCRARRWAVERTPSWMNGFRRLLIRWEKKAENSEARLHTACASITYRAAGLMKWAQSSRRMAAKRPGSWVDDAFQLRVARPCLGTGRWDEASFGPRVAR